MNIKGLVLSILFIEPATFESAVLVRSLEVKALLARSPHVSPTPSDGDTALVGAAAQLRAGEIVVLCRLC